MIGTLLIFIVRTTSTSSKINLSLSLSLSRTDKPLLILFTVYTPKRKILMECRSSAPNFPATLGVPACPGINGNRQECLLSSTSHTYLPSFSVTGLSGCQSLFIHVASKYAIGTEFPCL